ncbi:MAG: lactate utilization protein [Deltaproteobacteria bacterium]|nr:lactate utilization protein [Deltaproteobacteria bacterium]
MSDRDFLLRRVRSALEDVRRGEALEGVHAWAEERPGTSRSKGGLIQEFRTACSALPADVRTARTDEAVREHLLAVLREEKVRTYAAWRSSSLERLEIPGCLDAREFREAGADRPTMLNGDGSTGFKAATADADAGITGADFGLADTGTLVLEAGPGRERSLSLLPPVHVAVLCAENILASTFDLLAGPLSSWNGPGPGRSNVTLITGSSKTADIEMELVHGVHGPGRLYVILRV